MSDVVHLPHAPNLHFCDSRHYGPSEGSGQNQRHTQNMVTNSPIFKHSSTLKPPDISQYYSRYLKQVIYFLWVCVHFSPTRATFPSISPDSKDSKNWTGGYKRLFFGYFSNMFKLWDFLNVVCEGTLTINSMGR
jgi:hypothetical protein